MRGFLCIGINEPAFFVSIQRVGAWSGVGILFDSGASLDDAPAT
jgi:hypothetical protein